MTYLLIVEGQTILLTAEVAASDETIRNCIAPYYPEAATAVFRREEVDGVTRIHMVKSAGTKGSHQSGEEKIRFGRQSLKNCQPSIDNELDTNTHREDNKAGSFLSLHSSGSSPIDKLLGTTDLPKSLALFSKPCLGHVIQKLQSASMCLNPALTLSWQLKQLERQASIDIETLIELQPQIDNAIAVGSEWELSVQTSLDRLKTCSPSLSQTSIVGY